MIWTVKAVLSPSIHGRYVLVDKETGEEVQISNIINGKLYGVYSVVSNKTVREHEKFIRRWKNKNKNIPGSIMERTNRGYFIDGYNVDEKAVETQFAMTKNNRNWHPKKK